jgi:hypothetical protein
VTIKLSRLARSLNIKGQGHGMWVACNMEGLLRVIKVPAKKSISWVLLHCYKPTLENKSSSKTLSLPWVENQATLLEVPSLLWSTSLTIYPLHNSTTKVTSTCQFKHFKLLLLL